MEIVGKSIWLVDYTRERCHEFYKSYVSDPAMCNFVYVYNEQQVNNFYDHKVLSLSRIFFAIALKGRTIGEIQIKNIDFKRGFGTLSIHLQNDLVKNRGFGTEAEKLIINYAFNKLNLNAIYADTIHRNTRSQHVLEKIGFVHTYDDAILSYYKYDRNS